MKKVISVKHDKIWGYEIWLYSPLKGMETKFEDGTKPTKGPLVKIIRAEDNLSVQVHPNDTWAKKLENQPNGKSESWFILDANKGARLVMGLKNYDKKLIKAKLEDKSFESLLKTVAVKKGMFFNIPAGLIHGIGAGMTVFEVQQPSDVTYRYYDYNRLQDGKPRELHIDKALKVQKDLDYKLGSIKEDGMITYKNKVGTQVYSTKPIEIKKESLVIDLLTYDTFVFTKGEIVKFKKFVVVSL